MIDLILRQLIHLIEPIGFVWLCLLAIGIQSLRKRRFGMAVSALALFAILTAIGCTGLAGSLLAALERPYAAVAIDALPPTDAIVLLGGGAEPSRYEADEMHLTPAGDRLNMALHLVRLKKAPVLVIGGGVAVLDGIPVGESNVVQSWFAGLKADGLIPSGIQLLALPPCGNTHDEAVGTKALAVRNGWRRVLVVTSANHMRRALALFNGVELDATPAPCNFLTNISTSPEPSAIGLPSIWGFERMTTWLHEEFGWMECKRRGWIK